MLSLPKARIIVALLFLIDTAALVYACVKGDFFKDGGKIISVNPLGQFTIVDIYAMFILFCLWVLYRTNTTIGIINLLLTCTLGRYVSRFYPRSHHTQITTLLHGF